MNLPIRRNRGPSKAPTKLARKAIADFVESNIPRFNGWLNQIADGIPQYDGQGEVVLDAKGSKTWLVRPDPALALKLVVDVAEYHLPKLSRADVAVVAQVESAAPTDFLKRAELMTTADLKRLIAAQLLGHDVTAFGLPVIEDVTARPVDAEPLPSWMHPAAPEAP